MNMLPDGGKMRLEISMNYLLSGSWALTLCEM